MNTLLFLIAVGLTVFLTFQFFRLFGTRSNSIFISPDEKVSWSNNISGLLKMLLTTTNIFGTITSLATLLFLAGSAKLFGVFAFATGLTIAISVYVTNPITKKLLTNEKIKKRYEQSDQVGGVIASLFWDEDTYNQSLSRLVKYISIIGIFSIIWLEVSLFSDFSCSYLGVSDPISKTIVAAITFFIIFFFVVQYGLRGFVFADLLHAPLIIIMGLILVGILFIIIIKGNYPLTLNTFILPTLPWTMGLIFMFHVLVLNGFQIICTEPHWYRLWLFQGVVLTSQKKGVMGTGLVWIILLFIGFSTFLITGNTGEPGINDLLSKLSVSNPYFLFFFWVAATGALFSTVDAQLYSILLVSSFKISTGTLPIHSKRFQKPFVLSIYTSILFGIIYFVVKYFNIQFEKILLVIVPFSIVVLPLFVAKYTDRSPKISIFIISIVGYILVAAIGFILPRFNFYATLSAVFVPFVLSLYVLLSRKPDLKRNNLIN
jgi:hypothetical protein